MSVWQIESGACTGRGFASIDVDGICAKFFTYITALPAAGGPGWTILIDKSGTPTIQSFAAGDVDVGGNQITLAAHGYLTGDIVRFTTTTTLPGNLSLSTDYFVIKTGANTFKVATTLALAYAGTAIDITSQGTGPHFVLITGPYVVVSNVAAPAINEICHVIKVGYNTLEAGYMRVQHFLGFDDTNKIPIGLWNGQRLNTVDAGAFAYDFRGGDLGMIVQTRVGTSWRTAGVDTWVGSANFVEGTGVSTDLTGIAAAGAAVNIEVTDSSSFSVNKYYYIWDMSISPIVNYVKCTATPDPTHITVDLLSNTFPVGSIIAAYSHRFVAFGNGDQNSVVYLNVSTGNPSKLPYCSGAAGYVFGAQDAYLYGGCQISQELNALSQNAPNDEGYYAVQKGFITEIYRENAGFSQTGMNRAYGITSNIYFTKNTSLAAGLDGRTIGGNNYLFFLRDADLFCNGSYSLAAVLLDTESLV